MKFRPFAQILFFATLLFSFSAQSLSPEFRIKDEAKERRAMNLFLQVRCLVCGGQVIESSNTEFSFEMRKLIRQKILDGKSDQEIKDELSNEFGADILTEINSKNNATLLWFLPIAFALIIGFVLSRQYSKK
jgi:cytochrome c-type biogenesis protein CcmH